MDIDEATGITTAHSAMIGPGGLAEPFNYDQATFEIASYTKHFTALAMVHFELKQKGFANTTISRWFPFCDWGSAWYPPVANITLYVKIYGLFLVVVFVRWID